MGSVSIVYEGYGTTFIFNCSCNCFIFNGIRECFAFPSKIFENPNQIFIDNEQGERFKHLSNWEIKVFTKGIPELSKFALENIVKEL